MAPPKKPRIHLPLNERIKDGRTFEVSNHGKGKIYLRCTTKHCRGTAQKIGKRIVLYHSHSDHCFADNAREMQADFKQALKSALQSHYWELKNLYETIAVLYPPEIKVQIPYNSIKSSLKRWRRITFPPNPTGLEELSRQLEQPENSRFLEYDTGRLKCLRITDPLGKIHILFYDPQFVTSVFRRVKRLFIDATFQTTPKLAGVYQLLTVLGVAYNHALPFAHILMSSKTEAAYTAVLTELGKLINIAEVKVVMTDFEQALRNASRTVFTQALITGCNAHYDRALLKNINKLKLNKLVKENRDAKTFVRKLMALAFLPNDKILQEYENLKEALEPALASAFRGFLNYYQRQWLQIVKPAGFSVFGLTNRTNNVTESYNSILANKLGKHPCPWTFLAWQELYAGDLSSEQFLDKAANLKTHITQRLAVISNSTENDVEMTESPQNIEPAEDPDYDRTIFEGLRFDDVQDGAGSPAQSDNARESDVSASEISDNESNNSHNRSGNETELETSEESDSESEHEETSSRASNTGHNRPDVENEHEAPQEAISRPSNTVHEGQGVEIERQAPQESDLGSEHGQASSRASNSSEPHVIFVRADVHIPASNNADIVSVHGETSRSTSNNADVVSVHGEPSRSASNNADVGSAHGEPSRSASNNHDHIPNNAINNRVSDNPENQESEESDWYIDSPDEEPRDVVVANVEPQNHESDTDDRDLVDVIDDAGRLNGPIDADFMDIVDTAGTSGAGGGSTATGQQGSSNGKLSRSQKKNLRRKRRRQMRALSNQPIAHRPYGHKRRRKRIAKKEVAKPRCAVCLLNEPDHIFIPCGHECCCAACAARLDSEIRKRCPKCRVDYDKVYRVFKE